jgi:hypothetical protein
MKTITLVAVLLAGVAGACAKKQQVVMQSTDECIAARDAAQRTAAICEKCCVPPKK